MVTEIRNFGDGRTIVIYSDEKDVVKKLKERKSCFKVIPYEQQRNWKPVVVGFDFYFRNKYKQGLVKSLKSRVSYS